MNAIPVLLVVLGLTACGPTLQEELAHVRAGCASLTGSSAEAMATCQARQRAAFTAHAEAPPEWQETLWAFERLVAEKHDAGAISTAEAVFAVRDYRRRVEVEARQVEAARDSARAAELGNALTVWRTYFGDR